MATTMPVPQQQHVVLEGLIETSSTLTAAPFLRKTRIIPNPMRFFPQRSSESYRKYQFNITHSNELPLDRAIPDTRPPGCDVIKYDLEHLPSVSIIIPFHNEAWSVLLRTIVSVLNRTPLKLIREILLVDDASDYEYLKGPLDRYFIEFGDSRICLVRKDRREGLIVTRMTGARKAHGDVLVFLDAHVEVNVGWLEPLLNAIKHDHRIIAVPNIDDIRTEDLVYHQWLENRQGGFTWTLNYEWKHSPAETLNKHTATVPFPTATTIGCAMAIHRSYFFEIGAYDEGMLIWGGENLEISFRNWMCGGSIYIFPCSRVGHIFRKFLPYSFPQEFGGSGVINKNLQRVAEVWMDDYREYYYASIHHHEKFNTTEQLSLEKRKALRQRLSCKSFAWYLQHVLPEMPVPRRRPAYFGRLKSAVMKKCLYRVDAPNQTFALGSCYGYDQNNTFSLTAQRAIVLQTGECLIHNKARTGITHDSCDVVREKGTWSFVTENVDNFKASYPPELLERRPLGQLVFRNRRGHACLASSHGVTYPYFMSCNTESIRQFWYFTYQFKYEFVD